MGQIACLTTLMTMGAMGVILPLAKRRMDFQVSCNLRSILVGFLSASPLGFPPALSPGTKYAACGGKRGTGHGKLNSYQNPS